MAKMFTGSVNLTAKAGYLGLESGGDYDARTEALDVLGDLIAAAKAHKLMISAFVPGIEPTTKKGKVSLFSAAAFEKLAADRTPIIFQSSAARWPAPYMAMLPAQEQAAKPARAAEKKGPDLSRKPKAEPQAPALGRKRK